MIQKFSGAKDGILKSIVELIKTDYGTAYSPAKISTLFNISKEEASRFLETLVEKKEIERLSFGSYESEFGLYCCEKPKIPKYE